MTPPAELSKGAEAPVGTGFTYQGFLSQSGAPADGPWDFQFALFDAAVGGVQVGSTVTVGDLPVAAGVFTASPDFGVGAFGGGARWLEIRVRPGASGGAYTTLDPRQALTPAPIALSMPNVYADEASNFVGVGRNFRISGNEVFGVRTRAPPTSTAACTWRPPTPVAGPSTATPRTARSAPGPTTTARPATGTSTTRGSG
jgi:hypothetical protein